MIEGACHCGAVRWTYAGRPDDATSCNCTICRRYGALWIYGWADSVVTVSGATRTYTFGGPSDFCFCPTCGCLTHYIEREPGPLGRRKLAANLRMATDPDAVADLPLARFDGLHTFDDLPPDGRRVADLWF
ncbi:aldehyde-activating protein [Oceanicola sp. 22II-s10i]|uniref:GFA family protein n=1 Tax=Oceanicola sp. 22II-s10i TaxID=1317116 RepID=UPI000B526901|nr:GFA family protein [Oceanicola sp. 22II-s10i]OWU86833.1 aldehyde-activating protein [Oceanicola sp. 22II-s10i]